MPARRLTPKFRKSWRDDVPYINLWYFDNVLVHTRRVRNVTLNPSGNYDFLKTAEISASSQYQLPARDCAVFSVLPSNLENSFYR